MTNTTTYSAHKRRDLRLVCSALAALMFGFGIYQSTVYSFAVDKLGLDALQYSVVESIRETPGFLMVIIAALTMRIAEPRLAGAALSLIAMGMLGYGFVNDFYSFALFSFVWSIGLHTWMPLLSSMVLGLSDEGKQGKTLGTTNAVGSMATFAGFASVAIIGQRLSYPNWYFLSAAIVGIGALTILRAGCHGHSEKPRLVFKTRYRLYYALTFLEGCRKQVFITFAPFVLVKVYHTPVNVIAALMMINSVVNFTGFPLIGRLIDRVGERRVLMASYTCLIPVFLGYGFLRDVRLLYCLLCLDNLLYLSTIGLTTFLSRLAEPKDVLPSLSMGVTMNHIAAVIVPVVGGLIWASLGYTITFVSGAAVVLVSLLAASRIKPGKPRSMEGSR